MGQSITCPARQSLPGSGLGPGWVWPGSGLGLGHSTITGSLGHWLGQLACQLSVRVSLVIATQLGLPSTGSSTTPQLGQSSSILPIINNWVCPSTIVIGSINNWSNWATCPSIGHSSRLGCLAVIHWVITQLPSIIVRPSGWSGWAGFNCLSVQSSLSSGSVNGWVRFRPSLSGLQLSVRLSAFN